MLFDKISSIFVENFGQYPKIIDNAFVKYCFTKLYADRFICASNSNELIETLKVQNAHYEKIYPILYSLKEDFYKNSFKNTFDLIKFYGKKFSHIHYKGIAIKLSAIFPLKYKKNSITKNNLLEWFYSLLSLINEAKNYNIALIIDAEEDEIQHIIDHLFMKTVGYTIDSDNYHIYNTYQMYKRDCIKKLHFHLWNVKLIPRNFNVKIVRGAYINTDSKRNVLYSRKTDVDQAYNQILEDLIQIDKINVMIATHNEESVRKAIDISNHYIRKNTISIANLYGFESIKLIQLSQSNNIPFYVYMPFGNKEESWEYVKRRIIENREAITMLMRKNCQ